MIYRQPLLPAGADSSPGEGPEVPVLSPSHSLASFFFFLLAVVGRRQTWGFARPLLFSFLSFFDAGVPLAEILHDLQPPRAPDRGTKAGNSLLGFFFHHPGFFDQNPHEKEQRRHFVAAWFFSLASRGQEYHHDNDQKCTTYTRHTRKREQSKALNEMPLASDDPDIPSAALSIVSVFLITPSRDLFDVQSICIMHICTVVGAPIIMPPKTPFCKKREVKFLLFLYIGWYIIT
ncbi:hypothetical protein QBC38DRAFT_2868 [Podospora fimiseda]|uniref:Uncharacterized protein n=1 Tax=Podospora fimiseda TaxID=252190 RepID=A0AAN7BZM9_9PEZI|nr:hypothetical protein QBC38DRAFT_2868 [Podospora fimiseda]